MFFEHFTSTSIQGHDKFYVDLWVDLCNEENHDHTENEKEVFK